MYSSMIHERGVDTDFLMCVLRDLLKKRNLQDRFNECNMNAKVLRIL